MNGVHAYIIIIMENNTEEKEQNFKVFKNTLKFIINNLYFYFFIK